MYSTALTATQITHGHEHAEWARAAGDTQNPSDPSGLTPQRRQLHPDQPVLDGLDRQRGGDELPPGTVPGHRLHELRPRSPPRPAPRSTTPGSRPNTTYRYRVRATDAAGNLSGYSNIATATTQPGGGGSPGLVAAYAFDEGSGTNVTDASGNGNNGTVSNTSWTPSGKNGGALSFNGTTARVNVPGLGLPGPHHGHDPRGLGEPHHRDHGLAGRRSTRATTTTT